ncbi:MAG: glycosyl hydrolase family 18 protein [Thermaerobacter sp.]|nr:hypothetical protein [Bacillota bacterium]REJ32375.1 MAG: hypothetical protein DIU84_10190 [Bacillota bacterium]
MTNLPDPRYVRFGWVAGDEAAALADAGTPAAGITHVAPCWFVLDAEGRLEPRPDEVPAGPGGSLDPAGAQEPDGSPEPSGFRDPAGWAQGRMEAWRRRGIAVWPVIGTPEDDGAVLRSLLDHEQGRRRAADAVQRLCRDGGLPGVTLAAAGAFPEGRDAFSAFVEELAWALHASGARLALVVPPQVTDPAAAAAPDPLADPGGWLQARAASFDYRALAVYADLFIVDTRDYAVRPRIRRDAAGRLHVLGGPGAVAPQGWLESVIDHALLHVPARRLVLTLPLYGRAWPAGGQDADPDPGGAGDAAGRLVPLADAGRLLEGAQAVEEQPDRASGGRRVAWTDAGGRPWVLYIDDAPSLEAKAGLVARHDLGGLAFWRLGFGTPQAWAAVDRALAAPRRPA